MRSAQRRHRLEAKARKGKFAGLLKLAIIPVVLAAVYLFFSLSTKYWNGTDKLSYVYRQANGDVAVTVADPKLSEETTFIIPGDTQVNVSGSYGTLRIKNVWQLGLDEKLGGKLLDGTVTKDFLFPTYLWSDSDAESLKDGDLFGSIKFIVSPKMTNIPLGDRFSLALFALQVKSINKMEINLGASKYLQKTVLADGRAGYVLQGAPSERLTVYFADNDFSDEDLTVEINDATGAPGVADNVGRIVQVLGAKVATINKKPEVSQTDCTVAGKNSKIVKKIGRLFGCQTVGTQSNFDLELTLGSLFAKKF